MWPEMAFPSRSLFFYWKRATLSKKGERTLKEIKQHISAGFSNKTYHTLLFYRRILRSNEYTDCMFYYGNWALWFGSKYNLFITCIISYLFSGHTGIYTSQQIEASKNSCIEIPKQATLASVKKVNEVIYKRDGGKKSDKNLSLIFFYHPLQKKSYLYNSPNSLWLFILTRSISVCKLYSSFPKPVSMHSIPHDQRKENGFSNKKIRNIQMTRSCLCHKMRRYFWHINS